MEGEAPLPESFIFVNRAGPFKSILFRTPCSVPMLQFSLQQENKLAFSKCLAGDKDIPVEACSVQVERKYLEI